MERIRAKLNKFQEDIRKSRREEIMSQKRIWNEMPSVIVEIPYMIDHSKWEFIEELLDSIADRDIALIDAPLSEYIYKKYDEQFDREEKAEYSIPQKFNILRIVLRLKLAKPYHLCKLIFLIDEIAKILSTELTVENLQIFLKLIKELAIYFESTEDGKDEQQQIWRQEHRNLINRVCGNLRIYRYYCQHTFYIEYTDLMDKYRLFYVYLLADKRIDFKDYLIWENVGEIFYLIDECLNHTQTAEILKSIDIICKVNHFETVGTKETLICMKGMQALIIDGIDASRKYLEQTITAANQANVLQPTICFTGTFFTKLLPILCTSDVSVMIRIIELLAQLFELSDNYIEAVFRVDLNLPQEPKKESKVIKIKPKIHNTFFEYFRFSVNSILIEVRYKIYWMVSNITGSDNYYRKYGLLFFKNFYLDNHIQEEEGNHHVVNEINICIINYFCMVKYIDEIAELLTITPNESTLSKQPNLFFFGLDVMLRMLDRLHDIISENGFAQRIGCDHSYFHRIIYAFCNIIKIINENDRIEDLKYASFMSILEEHRVGLIIEQIHDKAKEGQVSIQMFTLIELLLQYFNKRQADQKLL